MTKKKLEFQPQDIPYTLVLGEGKAEQVSRILSAAAGLVSIIVQDLEVDGEAITEERYRKAVQNVSEFLSESVLNLLAAHAQRAENAENAENAESSDEDTVEATE